MTECPVVSDRSFLQQALDRIFRTPDLNNYQVGEVAGVGASI